MWVLGINWQWHDSAAALVDGEGRVWAAVEEERFSGVKHAWGSFPAGAAAACLAQARIDWRDLDAIAVGWDIPHSNLWHFPARDREHLLLALFGESGAGPEIVFVEHHVAHALSSFHASGFEAAAVLVVDGSGEFYSSSIYAADRTGLKPLRHWHRGHSLGALYEATTRSLGLGILDAGKTMGLAPYFPGPVEPLPLGSFDDEAPSPFGLHPRTRYDTIVAAWNGYLANEIGLVRAPSGLLHQDPVALELAGRAQRTVEQAIGELHAQARSLSGREHVCLAGGVALNSVANGKLPDPLYVPPFPHDGGVALGAAWSIAPPTVPGLLASPYLGPSPGAAVLEGLAVMPFLPEQVCDLLLRGQIGAIVEGRAELGPRALGHRSIVALPTDPAMRDRLNAVKRREVWRPFAPVTLPGYADRLWPRQGLRELYMIGNAAVTEHGRAVLPAAIHVDGSTRPQVLPAGAAPVLQSLLESLESASRPPVLVNTSFNGPGQPIVTTAAEAVRSFRDLGLDFLVLGDRLVQR